MAKLIKKGKYPYVDSKKQSKKQKKKEQEKLQRKMLEKQDKALKKQCNCNHIDCDKGKSHFKYSKDGLTKTCKICGGVIINDPNLLTKPAVENASQVVYSVLSYARANLRIDEKTDNNITKALLITSRLPELLDLVMDTGKSKKEKKKDKKKKKNNGSKFSRIIY